MLTLNANAKPKTCTGRMDGWVFASANQVWRVFLRLPSSVRDRELRQRVAAGGAPSSPQEPPVLAQRDALVRAILMMSDIGGAMIHTLFLLLYCYYYFYLFIFSILNVQPFRIG